MIDGVDVNDSTSGPGLSSLSLARPQVGPPSSPTLPLIYPFLSLLTVFFMSLDLLF